MSRRYLTQRQLEEEARKIFEEENTSSSSIEDPFHDSDFSDENYEPSENDTDSSNKENEPEASSSSDEENLTENEVVIEPEEQVIEPEEQNERPDEQGQNTENVMWFNDDGRFVSRFLVPQNKTVNCLLSCDLNEVELFLKAFPKSLMMFIAHCTNLRLEKFEKDTKKKRIPTDYHEIMIVLGVSLIMAYNRVPAFNNYWSNNESLGNSAIKKSISRDRCKLLLSKMYFNIPERPENATKLYYIEEVINCLKVTFPKYRSEATHQSIDESMAKFKGRSSLKQYLPMKPIKRGIKIWVRSDSSTGYVYDMNVYAGKDTGEIDGTLGERIVKKLSSCIREKDVVLCFDRFFLLFFCWIHCLIRQ